MYRVVCCLLLCFVWGGWNRLNAADAGLPAGPRLSLASSNQHVLNLQFNTDPSRKYRLSVSRDLQSWNRMGVVLTGTGSTIALPIEIRADPFSFIRLESSPEFEQVLPVRVSSPSNAVLSLSFPTQSGRKYRLSLSHDARQWAPWGAAHSGTGANLSLPYDLTDDRNVFFRVEWDDDYVPTDSMVWIQPGTFNMGSPNTEKDREGDEGPLTAVTITRGFWIGRHEVTQREYLALTGVNPSEFKGEERPVDSVTWQDAISYCNQLTFREAQAGRIPPGYAYRLPTEAEFEYVCRAGTTNRFSFGDDLAAALISQYAWYDTVGGQRSHIVGKRLSNPWGLFDLHGNLWEWCMDWYSNRYAGKPVNDPIGARSSEGRLIRGGGWDYRADTCRCAYRNYSDPKRKINYVGFRLVLGPILPGLN